MGDKMMTFPGLQKRSRGPARVKAVRHSGRRFAVKSLDTGLPASADHASYPGMSAVFFTDQKLGEVI
jgi:hypothetical protein